MILNQSYYLFRDFKSKLQLKNYLNSRFEIISLEKISGKLTLRPHRLTKTRCDPHSKFDI